MTTQIAHGIERWSAAVIVFLAIATGGMVVPLAWMQPTSSASQEPRGELFEARDLLERRFSSGVCLVRTSDRGHDRLGASVTALLVLPSLLTLVGPSGGDRRA